ncbi:hypothetical protein [Urechidicola croceus]|uniref:Uncharacterized protein n=1 Tax=Urechidicola croceus TaxID=1850246 RepID=A0A1D8P421_9FLAO|nr:hypothetical protein [Urechidicola croceus]AOW19334.1 hypothetical protein LPB138_00950 [Urechidicola croceus]
MKSTNPWTFAILLIFGFIIFAWNDFQIPFSPLTETKEITGRISNIKIVPVIGGHGFQQEVTYYYFIEDKKYSDTKRIGKKYGIQYVGNQILVKYSVNEPQKTEVISFKGDYTEDIKETYFSYIENGYLQIELYNGLFNYSEYAKKGKLVTTYDGEFLSKNDTLILKPFDRKVNNKTLISNWVNGKNVLTDLNTNLIYK